MCPFSVAMKHLMKITNEAFHWGCVWVRLLENLWLFSIPLAHAVQWHSLGIFLCEAFLMYDYPLALPVSRFKFWFGQDVVLDLIVFESILHFNWGKRYPTLPFDFHQWWLVFSFYWCDLLHTEIISRNTSRYFSTVRKKPSNWKRKFRWAWRQSKIWF